ncbi:PTS-dependent dihydroxyacetone kinase phosphotransferase subunit DhaM [Aerococcaceae bacterium zg-BR22]|uniref:dihydroxyacetone kinase phosphoryl donor subunit DhaM n=1 Tax=Aerococcaceae bacterium zg-1292 TaxID=2774330 RepID=UPI004062DC01|nr:PTS-dependent dihydroxyacetone kinase phosphotransferase subunit DhaM [Aerococcaceae bacterium zg-BR22]
MQKKIGIVIVSHSQKLVEGLVLLLQEVAKDVCITFAGGFNGGIGTSLDTTLNAIESNSATNIYAFFDLGSARMTLEAASELTEKSIQIFNVPIVEGSYTAAALLQVDTSEVDIQNQLLELNINK